MIQVDNYLRLRGRVNFNQDPIGYLVPSPVSGRVVLAELVVKCSKVGFPAEKEKTQLWDQSWRWGAG